MGPLGPVRFPVLEFIYVEARPHTDKEVLKEGAMTDVEYKKILEMIEQIEKTITDLRRWMAYKVYDLEGGKGNEH